MPQASKNLSSVYLRGIQLPALVNIVLGGDADESQREHMHAAMQPLSSAVVKASAVLERRTPRGPVEFDSRPCTAGAFRQELGDGSSSQAQRPAIRIGMFGL